MTDKQPEALMLADSLEDGSYICDKAAVELRRLHEENAELTRVLEISGRANKMMAEAILSESGMITDKQLDEFHWHEIIDRVRVLHAMFSDHIHDHPCAKHSELAPLIDQIDHLLDRLYQEAGRVDFERRQ